MPIDIYRPELWRDFFVMVGGAAAVLTGLVFVSISLNIDVIARDETHRHRAIGTLAGFSSVFMTCALVLMGGQDHMAIGIEWFIIATLAGVIYVNGFVQAIRRGGSAVGLLSRIIPGTTLYVAQAAAAFLLTLGFVTGLYAAAVAMIILLVWGISGAWLLVMGPTNRTKPQ